MYLKVILFIFTVTLTGKAAGSVLKPYTASCQNQVQESYAQLAAGKNPHAPSVEYCPLENKLITWEWLMKPGNDAEFEDYRSFLESNLHWPSHHVLQEKAENVLTSATPKHDIYSFFAHTKPHTVNGLVMYVQALKSDGYLKKANQLIRKMWNSQKLTAGEEIILLNRYKNILSPSDHLRRIEHLMMRGDIYGLERMATYAPAYKSFIQTGIAYIKKQSKADKLWRKLPADFQLNTAMQYLQLEQLLKHGNELSKKRVLLRKFSEAYGTGVTQEHPHDWWKIRMICIRLAVELGQVQQAYIWAKNHGTLHDNEKLAEIEWLAGWIALRHLHDPQGALIHFKALGDRVTTPISKAKAAYWMGRAYEAAGSKVDAHTTYTKASFHAHTFYGQRALEKLGYTPTVVLKKEFTPAPVRHPSDSELLQVIQVLFNLGQQQKVEKFLLHVAKNAHPTMVEEIVNFTHQLGLSHLVVLVAKFAGRRGPILLDIAYPVIQLPPLNHPNEAITPSLLYSLIRQESGFHIKAQSGAGALGLMQLMPATAALIARKLDIRFNSTKPHRLTQDHQFNLQLGVHNFQELMESFQNNLILTLAGYNAGPQRPLQWIENIGDPRNPNIDWIDWIEQMPFAETRSYVQRILEILPIYQEKLKRI